MGSRTSVPTYAAAKAEGFDFPEDILTYRDVGCGYKSGYLRDVDVPGTWAHKDFLKCYKECKQQQAEWDTIIKGALEEDLFRVASESDSLDIVVKTEEGQRELRVGAGHEVVPAIETQLECAFKEISFANEPVAKGLTFADLDISSGATLTATTRLYRLTLLVVPWRDRLRHSSYRHHMNGKLEAFYAPEPRVVTVEADADVCETVTQLVSDVYSPEEETSFHPPRQVRCYTHDSKRPGWGAAHVMQGYDMVDRPGRIQPGVTFSEVSYVEPNTLEVHLVEAWDELEKLGCRGIYRTPD